MKKNQFASDNYAGICPEAWQALQEADNGTKLLTVGGADDIQEIMG
jgi:threonine aldolase